MEKPIKRTFFRVLVGKVLFSVKKILYLWKNRKLLAKDYLVTILPNSVFSHKTPLFREYKSVDDSLQKNKVHNLKIAVKNLNGVVIKPGNIFSYWYLIGNPTRRKGYMDGMILHNGKVLAGVGGGLCQLSNLIYWMILHTPLEIIERHRHGYDVFPDANRTQPFGSGATCYYPFLDLQLKNTTNQNFQLKLKVTDEFLEGEFLSQKDIPYKYEIVEKDHLIKQEWWGGYTRNNKIIRRIINKETHEILREEVVAENHAIMMYEPLLKGSDLS